MKEHVKTATIRNKILCYLQLLSNSCSTHPVRLSPHWRGNQDLQEALCVMNNYDNIISTSQWNYSFISQCLIDSIVGMMRYALRIKKKEMFNFSKFSSSWFGTKCSLTVCVTSSLTTSRSIPRCFLTVKWLQCLILYNYYLFYITCRYPHLHPDARGQC